MTKCTYIRALHGEYIWFNNNKLIKKQMHCEDRDVHMNDSHRVGKLHGLKTI